jgi:uncharacterized membrane protein
MLTTALITVLACDALFALIAIPLLLRKVKPNVIYGFRTPTTLSNDVVWYETNAFFGWTLLGACAVSALAMWAIYRSDEPPGPKLMNESLAALAGPPLIAAILTWRFSRAVARRVKSS